MRIRSPPPISMSLPQYMQITSSFSITRVSRTCVAYSQRWQLIRREMRSAFDGDTTQPREVETQLGRGSKISNRSAHQGVVAPGVASRALRSGPPPPWPGGWHKRKKPSTGSSRWPRSRIGAALLTVCGCESLLDPSHPLKEARDENSQVTLGLCGFHPVCSATRCCRSLCRGRSSRFMRRNKAAHQFMRRSRKIRSGYGSPSRPG